MTHFPRINPISEGQRPFWSVMIPAYEGADYLAKTIQSVLVQDPGPSSMQIEVVDDHSVKEDLEAVVGRVGKGRVSYYRKPQNAGPIANFNTCLERSIGRWVHLLHADDLILPGFYERLYQATTLSNARAAFCRHFFMDEDDHWTAISALEAKSPGILTNWVDKVAISNHAQAPSIVVSREAYEEIGGYDPRLPHCADWDMWKRIASAYPVWFEPSVLASYRVHSKSDTSRLARTAANVRDARRSIEYARAYLPAAAARELTSKARLSCANNALDSARSMLGGGDARGALAQAREALMTACSPRLLLRLASIVLLGARTLLSSQSRATQN